jgi:hypothetical protein
VTITSSSVFDDDPYYSAHNLTCLSVRVHRASSWVARQTWRPLNEQPVCVEIPLELNPGREGVPRER